MSPARLVPWLLLALLAILPSSRSAAEPLPMPPLDFGARADFLEVAADPDSLVHAAILRRALDQSAQADADIDRFLSWLSWLSSDPARCAQAAEVYLTEVLDPAVWPEPERWQAALRRFLAVLPSSSSSPLLTSVRARAEIELAAYLWQASCPLDAARRSDDACIERIDAAAEYSARIRAEATAAHRAVRRYISKLGPCYDPPAFRYVVPPRRPDLTREAQALLARALRRAGSLPLDAALRAALAQARFLQAEPHFEAALAHRIPSGLVFDPSRPRRMESSKARLAAWLDSRASTGSRGGLTHPPEERYYQAVLAYNDPAWSLAAHSRLGQLLLDVEDQLFHYPYEREPFPPSGIEKGAMGPSRSGVHCGEPIDSFLERACLDHLQRCDAESSRLLIDTPYTRTCHALLRGLRPSDVDGPLGIFAAPAWQTPLTAVRYEPGLSEK